MPIPISPQKINQLSPFLAAPIGLLSLNGFILADIATAIARQILLHSRFSARAPHRHCGAFKRWHSLFQRRELAAGLLLWSRLTPRYAAGYKAAQKAPDPFRYIEPGARI